MKNIYQKGNSGTIGDWEACGPQIAWVQSEKQRRVFGWDLTVAPIACNQNGLADGKSGLAST
jgi:hypothetical protein